MVVGGVGGEDEEEEVQSKITIPNLTILATPAVCAPPTPDMERALIKNFEFCEEVTNWVITCIWENMQASSGIIMIRKIISGEVGVGNNSEPELDERVD